MNPNAQLRARLSAVLGVTLCVFYLLGTRSYASMLVPAAPWDKLAHLVVFGGFAAIIWIIDGARRAWPAIFIVVALGCLDESLQSFTPGRDADWHDIVADLCGALAAVGMMSLLRWRLGRAILPGALSPLASSGR